jgi:hypothetical protein
LVLAGLAFLALFVYVGFKMKAKCRILTDRGTPCKRNSKVVLGCKQDHKWEKPVAWLRRVGFRRLIDRLYLQFTKEPPVLVPFGGLPPDEAAEIKFRHTAVFAHSDPLTPKELREQRAQVANYRVAQWSLIFGIVQALTGIVSLLISLA